MKFRSAIISLMIAALIPAVLSSCVKVLEEGPRGKELIVLRSVADAGSRDTKGKAIESNLDLVNERFGIYAELVSSSATHFNSSATVNNDFTATLAPEQHWPDDGTSALKFFSWYPYSGTYAPAAGFSTPGQMVLSYTADANAANHVDVMAAVSQENWGEDVGIHFYHALTKVTFTFIKVDPQPAEVTINKIELQGVGKGGTLTLENIPANSPNKPGFTWDGVTTGNISSVPTSGNMATDVRTQIGDTFMMIPATGFSPTAKIVITTSLGENDFLLQDIVTANAHTWRAGEHINYNIKLSNDTFQITAYPLEWDESPETGVIFDGQYYLKVSQTQILLGIAASTVPITVVTNYDANPNTGYDAGAKLDLTGILAWARPSMSAPSISNGVYTYTLTVDIDSYDGAAGQERETGYYITAGNLKHKMSIKQYGGDGIWLTANVVPDTTDDTDRKKIVVNSGEWTWRVSNIANDSIFLNTETILGADGGDIYFYFKATASSGDKATLTFTNTNGNNPPVLIEITVP